MKAGLSSSQSFQQWLRDAVARLRATMRPSRVILFGSWAYGRPTPDSDVDLLIVMPSSKSPAERIRQVSQALEPRRYPVDVIVLTPGEVKKRRRGFDPFLEEVLTKGRILYEAS